MRCKAYHNFNLRTFYHWRLLSKWSAPEFLIVLFCFNLFNHFEEIQVIHGNTFNLLKRGKKMRRNLANISRLSVIMGKCSKIFHARMKLILLGIFLISFKLQSKKMAGILSFILLPSFLPQFVNFTQHWLSKWSPYSRVFQIPIKTCSYDSWLFNNLTSLTWHIIGINNYYNSFLDNCLTFPGVMTDFLTKNPR